MEIPVTVPGSDDFLLPSLKSLFPNVESYTVERTIVQGNAIGYILSLHVLQEQQTAVEDPSSLPSAPPSSITTTTPYRVFCKHVDATVYVRTKKSWNDLRRTLMYARTEARVYEQFAPLLGAAGLDAIPHHYLALYQDDVDDADAWVPQNERATAPVDPNYTIDMLPQPSKLRGGLIILECIDQDSYFQASPLSIPQAKQCLSAVAKLHVAAWENVELLQQAEKQLSKASFHLETRNPSELAGLEAAWQHFRTNFFFQQQDDDKQSSLLQWTRNESVQQLGVRTAAAAPYLSQMLTPAPTAKHATLCHGDYKAMNVFLPKNDDDDSKNEVHAKIVDYASTGIGMGMSDVAMHIHHAVLPEDLENNGGEEELVRHYWKTVNEALGCKNNDDNGNERYPWTVAWWHYRVAVVDYFRFFLGRFWKSATPESMAQKADNENTCLLNRSIPAALAFVRRVDLYLTEIEAEMATW